jgi:hypothetical protein
VNSNVRVHERIRSIGSLGWIEGSERLEVGEAMKFIYFGSLGRLEIFFKVRYVGKFGRFGMSKKLFKDRWGG